MPNSEQFRNEMQKCKIWVGVDGGWPQNILVGNTDHDIAIPCLHSTYIGDRFVLRRHREGEPHFPPCGGRCCWRFSPNRRVSSEYPSGTVPASTASATLSPSPPTRMNSDYCASAAAPGRPWVSSNEQVFVFVRLQFVSPSDHQLVRELQIDIKRPFYYPFYREGSAIILSTFKLG